MTFLDTMLQMTILGSEDKALRVPTRIQSVRIDPVAHQSYINADDISRKSKN